MTTDSMFRLRAGFLVLMALIFLSFVAGRWTAALFSLSFLWAGLIGVVVAALVALVISRLDRLAYVIIAAIVTLVGAFTVYDFAHGPVDWSETTALLLSGGAALLLAAAFWDFANLLREFRRWMAARN